MTAAPMQPDTYVFDGDRTKEERRLIAQARLTDPIAEPFLREAGVTTGMRVLDLGSGAGDTGLLVANLVGPTGSVLGIERSAESVALAQRRIAEAGVSNVAVQQGDVVDLRQILAAPALPDVDVVMGRLILMWVPDRLAILRACAEGLRPGALVWFLEPDMTYDYAMPAGPLWSKLRTWIGDTISGLGVEARMGPRLYWAFKEAGLPEPVVRTTSTLFARLPGGMAALAAGRAEEAVEQFAHGWRESDGAPGWGDLTLAPLAEARFAAGDLDGARAAAEEVLARCAAESLRWQEGLARLVLARVARARNDAPGADLLALDALALYVSVGADGPAADVLEFLAAGMAAVDALGAARLLGAAGAIRDRLGYRRFRVHADAVAAAVAAVEAILGPDAEAARAEGAAFSLTDAVAYATRVRGPRGRRQAGWESLTPAEADVVRLVAEGLRNKDIGARLFVSPRTVQTHLTHVYAKLGVTSRVQLVNEVVRRREA